MSPRTLTIAPLLFLLLPQVVIGQTSDTPPPELGRFSLQAGAGRLVNSGGGHTVSGTFSFSPLSRVDVAVNV